MEKEIDIILEKRLQQRAVQDCSVISQKTETLQPEMIADSIGATAPSPETEILS